MPAKNNELIETMLTQILKENMVNKKGKKMIEISYNESSKIRDLMIKQMEEMAKKKPYERANKLLEISLSRYIQETYNWQSYRNK